MLMVSLNFKVKGFLGQFVFRHLKRAPKSAELVYV